MFQFSGHLILTKNGTFRNLLSTRCGKIYRIRIVLSHPKMKDSSCLRCKNGKICKLSIFLNKDNYLSKGLR